MLREKMRENFNIGIKAHLVSGMLKDPDGVYTLADDLTEYAIRTFESAIPKERNIPKNGFSGFNSCCAYREIDSYNECIAEMKANLGVKG